MTPTPAPEPDLPQATARYRGAGTGRMIPEVTLPAADGSEVSLESYHSRWNLVLVLEGDAAGAERVHRLVSSLARHPDELDEETARVLLVTTSPPAAAEGTGGAAGSSGTRRLPFPTLIDRGAKLHRRFGAVDASGTPVPAVVIADRFGEIFTTYRVPPGAKPPTRRDVVQWLVFINIQCPECGNPEW